MNQIAEHCEAKLHALRKTQEGVVIAFVIHPNDIPNGVMLAQLGTRYMVAMAEIGDDEKPKSGWMIGTEPIENFRTTPVKPKREMTLANIIGRVCANAKFAEFLNANYPERATDINYCVAGFVRDYCGVKSRSDIIYDTPEAEKWKELYTQYQEWSGR